MVEGRLPRTLGAAIVAPFPAALFQAVVVGIWPKLGQGIHENPSSMFVAICLYFYVSGLIIGVPTWFAWRKRDQLRARSFAILGAAIGLAPMGIVNWVLAFQNVPDATYVIVYTTTLFGIGGLVAGLLFWRLRVRKDPRLLLEATFS